MAAMNVLNLCLRSRVDASMFSPLKRSYSMCYSTLAPSGKPARLSANRSPSLRPVPSRCFMKKMGSNSMYDVYDKKAAKDNISPAEYTLIYNGTGETYVRWLSGILIATIVVMPTVFATAYVYMWYTEGCIEFKTFLEILFLSHTQLEVYVMLGALVFLKLGSHSFISKYVLRIYKHNIKNRYIGVYINPILPWKSVTCPFDKATKLPNGWNFLAPWYTEYYKLAGNKSIVLRERFRRPIDYDRMVGIRNTKDE